jgi:hypothetical protein
MHVRCHKRAQTAISYLCVGDKDESTADGNAGASAHLVCKRDALRSQLCALHGTLVHRSGALDGW